MAENGGAKDQPASRLGRILREHPEARPRLTDAIGSLMKVVLAAVAVIGLLAIWHLRRRARLIRNRLGPPRETRQQEFEETAPEESGR